MTAQGIEAAQADETRSGSAEGESPTRRDAPPSLRTRLAAVEAERDEVRDELKKALRRWVDVEIEISAALARAVRAEKALEAIRAREATEAKQIATEQAAQNIAYLQANIAQMERFMERGEEADPIGYMQWRHRRDEFRRELDAALSPTQET